MKEAFDYIVLGAGPAGLQLAYYLHQHNRSYVVLEGGRPGAFFHTYPRHRKLISINKVHTGFDDPEKNLRWDWNSLLSDDPDLVFSRFSKKYWPAADDMVRYLEAFAAHFELRIRSGVRVVRIARDAEGFLVDDADGSQYRAARVIVATGVSKPYTPPIPGIELAENYADVSLDVDEFANQRVLVIGKGNSAFETAEHLNDVAALIHLVSPSPLKMAWKTHFVGDLRAVNNNLLDTYQLKLQNAILDATVARLERQADGRIAATVHYTHADGEQETLVYDRVIVCAGFRMDPSIFDASAMPELTIKDRFPKLTAEWESVNVPHLYFAGTLMQSRDFKKTSSGFIHGFRYNVLALGAILNAKYHGVELDYRLAAATPDVLCSIVLDTVDRSSALWQQFGFTGDILHITGATGCRWYQALPVDYVHETLMQGQTQYYVVTLEYGHNPTMQDPFSAPRIARNDIVRARDSQFLHPVVRCFRAGQLVAEHHVLEDLETRWDEDIHRQPLRDFFETTLRPPTEQRVDELLGIGRLA